MTKRTRRWILASMGVAAMLMVAPSSAYAQEGGDEDDLVVLTGDADVGEGETVDHVVVFDGAATIDGTVQETVVVFNGPLTISGSVGEDVVAFNGLVTVRSGARIGGDLVTRQTAVVEEGATVEGETRTNIDELFRDPFPFLGRIASWLAVTVSILVLGLLFLWLAPRAAEAVAEAWRTGTGASVGWGILVLVGLPILAILLVITLVGIPFGIGLMLALAFIYSLGYVAGAVVVGSWVMRPPSSRIWAFLVGLAILRALALIPIVAGIVGTLATVFGLGAIAVAIWRTRRPVAVTTAAP